MENQKSNNKIDFVLHRKEYVEHFKSGESNFARGLMEEAAKEYKQAAYHAKTIDRGEAKLNAAQRSYEILIFIADPKKSPDTPKAQRALLYEAAASDAVEYESGDLQVRAAAYEAAKIRIELNEPEYANRIILKYGLGRTEIVDGEKVKNNKQERELVKQVNAMLEKKLLAFMR